MTDASAADAPLQDAQTAFSGTREVDPRYRLDETGLDAWMTENVAGFAGPLTVRQFKGGVAVEFRLPLSPDRFDENLVL